jgi:hypothetical protein
MTHLSDPPAPRGRFVESEWLEASVLSAASHDASSDDLLSLFLQDCAAALAGVPGGADGVNGAAPSDDQGPWESR